MAILACHGDDAARNNASVHMLTRHTCRSCGAAMDASEALAVTVSRGGRYERWTRGRAAFYAHNARRTAPTVTYLCAACARVHFGDDVLRPEVSGPSK